MTDKRLIEACINNDIKTFKEIVFEENKVRRDLTSLENDELWQIVCKKQHFELIKLFYEQHLFNEYWILEGVCYKDVQSNDEIREYFIEKHMNQSPKGNMIELLTDFMENFFIVNDINRDYKSYTKAFDNYIAKPMKLLYNLNVKDENPLDKYPSPNAQIHHMFLILRFSDCKSRGFKTIYDIPYKLTATKLIDILYPETEKTKRLPEAVEDST